MPVSVKGPDGKTYQFPDGTDKAAAIGYFKKKGIKAAAPEQPSPPSGVGSFLSSAAAPFIGAAKGIYSAVTTPPQGTGEKLTSLLGPGALPMKRMFIDPQIEQGKEALDTSKSAPERVGHGLAAALPLFGPWAAQVGETTGKQLGSGDYSGAAGTVAGNAALALAPKAVGKLRSIAPEARVNKLAYASGVGTTDAIKSSLPDVQKAVAKTGAPKTVGGYLDTINTAKGDLNTEYGNALGPFANRPTMPTAISQRILALETPNMMKTAAGRSEAKAIRKAATEFQQPWTLGELDAERMDANSRLEAYEKKSIADQYSTLKKSRSVAIDKAIADGVRETVYPQMDQLTGKPSGYFANLKQRIGNLMELQSKVDRQVKELRDKTARIKGAPLLSKGQAAEGAGSAAAGYKHGVVRTLARAVIPENPERTANKRVAKALRPERDATLDLPLSAIMGEQQGNDQPQQ